MNQICTMKARALAIVIVCSLGVIGAGQFAGAAQIVNFDASGLALLNGQSVTTWDGRSASGTPTYLTGQTPNGGSAVQFNGADHFGQASLASNAAADFIIAAVVNPNAINAYHNIIDDDDQNRPMLWIDNGNTYEMNFGNGAAGSASRPGPVDGSWDIIIADSRNGQIYFNSPTVTHAMPAIAWNPGSENFDFFNRDGAQTFQGLVAEVRVYNNAADFGGDFAALYSELNTKWFVVPAPEPSSCSLIVMGIAGLSARSRKKRAVV